MRPMIAGIVFVLVIITGAQPATAQVTVTIDPGILPMGGTTPFAHAWVETNSPVQKCGPTGQGVTGSPGGSASCPLMTNTDSLGDQATAQSSASCTNPPSCTTVNLSASSNAFKVDDPAAYAAAAAYAKLGINVQTSGSNAGGAFTITHGGLTIEGSSEPVDTVYELVVSNLGLKEIPTEFQGSFTQAGKGKLPAELQFVPIKEEYLRLKIVLDGKTKKIKRPEIGGKGFQPCPKQFDQKTTKITQPCALVLQAITENDFSELCPGQHEDCKKDKQRTVHSQKKDFKAKVWFPPVKNEKGRFVSVDTIQCTQVTGTTRGGPVKKPMTCNLP